MNMRTVPFLILGVVFMTTACMPPDLSLSKNPVLGKLRVGFDIDDTILFSRDNFLKAPHMSEDPDNVDFGWVNRHDSLYSVIIKPIAELITFYQSQGHEIYFITARPGMNGEYVGRHLTRELGFPVEMGKNLFFSAKKKDPVSGHRFTTKHETISLLGLHIFYGDSDTDMVAASVAGVRAVRVVRDQRSVLAYSKNYFGNTRSSEGGSPYSDDDYRRFLANGVGPYGETIFPIYLQDKAPQD